MRTTKSMYGKHNIILNRNKLDPSGTMYCRNMVNMVNIMMTVSFFEHPQMKAWFRKELPHEWDRLGGCNTSIIVLIRTPINLMIIRNCGTYDNDNNS